MLADALVNEARTLACLNHPGIVTVYDIGEYAEHVYIVQEFVDGQDLRRYFESRDLSHAEIIRIVIDIARAIAYAHRHSIIHRDLKPSNILIEKNHKARVADFGLALNEITQRSHRGQRAGTPAYMSPEQIRGESHRLDGRTDIWSIGVIFYELLSHKRPFGGNTGEELFDEILQRDPRPPRQINAGIPEELERICLKALSKRMVDRYSTAEDMAEDLKVYLDSFVKNDEAPSEKSATSDYPQIIPKGLRPYGAEDAEFFYDLLPGPRNRSGIPTSLSFWKSLRHLVLFSQKLMDRL